MPLTKVGKEGITGVSNSSDATAITIDSNENVGIGTTSPSDNLEVTPSADGKGITLKTTDNVRPYLNFDANRSSAGNNLAHINFKWNGTDVARIIGVAGSDTTNKDDGHVSFQTASAGSTDERMRITSSGNVGLGATALSLNAPNLLTIRNSSNGNEADVMLGNQTIRRGFVGINSSETRYFKCLNYSLGNMFAGDIKMFVSRGGGFNQTQAFRHYNCSIVGYNNTLRGFVTDSQDSGHGGVGEIHLGTDEGIYIKVSSSIYGGDVFFTFEGAGIMDWVFNNGTYVTSAP